MTHPTPYIHFPGSGREALTFYGDVFGCGVQVHTAEPRLEHSAAPARTRLEGPPMPRPCPTRRRHRSSMVAAVLLAALALSGCGEDAAEPVSSSSGDRATEAGLLAAYDLEDLDTRAVIERLDAMAVAERPTGLMASVQPDAVVLTDAERGETRLPMPEDEVYLSIAPYREQTHECHFHSLTTCLGELGNADVRVIVTDADGETVLDEARQTFDNGFVGVWVPRGLADATLRITHQGRSGTATISTVREDDPTCITTLRLR